MCFTRTLFIVTLTLLFSLSLSYKLTIHWTVDNAGFVFLNGSLRFRDPTGFNDWTITKTTTPTYLSDAVIITIKALNSNGPAALFARVLVDDKVYAVSGDGNWVVLNPNPLLGTDPPFSISPNDYDFDSVIKCPKDYWRRGDQMKPIWEASNDPCYSNGIQTRIFAVAVSEYLNASDAKRAWLNHSLFVKPNAANETATTITTSTESSSTTTARKTTPTETKSEIIVAASGPLSEYGNDDDETGTASSTPKSTAYLSTPTDTTTYETPLTSETITIILSVVLSASAIVFGFIYFVVKRRKRLNHFAIASKMMKHDQMYSNQRVPTDEIQRDTIMSMTLGSLLQANQMTKLKTTLAVNSQQITSSQWLNPRSIPPSAKSTLEFTP